MRFTLKKGGVMVEMVMKGVLLNDLEGCNG